MIGGRLGLPLFFGMSIDSLPDELEKEFCAKDAADVWAFEDQVRSIYYAFPSFLYPREDLRDCLKSITMGQDE
jgi:hypothetical protein